MALLARFDTPASLRDMPIGSPFYDDWHNYISGSLAASTPGSGGIGEFYNPALTDVNVVGKRSLNWMAYPRQEFMPLRDDRIAALSAAEERLVQNEYCEWRVSKNKKDKITKIVFVTEAQEYWEHLWAVDRIRVVSLYRSILNEPAVTESDLADTAGNYLRRNKWNDTPAVSANDTIVHLIQSINTLDAALGLAQGAVASPFVNDNFEILSPAETSVDPRVLIDVPVLARKGLSVTLKDPIGLYMTGWDDAGWTKPNGKPVGNYWTIERGRPGQALRLKYEVPKKEGFVVGDILIGGRPIKFGGQIAEHVTVSIVGLAGVRAGSPSKAGNYLTQTRALIDEKETQKAVHEASLGKESETQALTRQQRFERSAK